MKKLKILLLLAILLSLLPDMLFATGQQGNRKNLR